jgi:hypothetical protein
MDTEMAAAATTTPTVIVAPKKQLRIMFLLAPEACFANRITLNRSGW